MENISPEDLEMIQEFVQESKDNLSRVGSEITKLESQPQDAELVVPIFRTMHTIKGACGFLGFPGLEKMTMQAECLLGQLRDGQRKVSGDHLSLIRETVEATSAALAAIEASGSEGVLPYEGLTERLHAATL